LGQEGGSSELPEGEPPQKRQRTAPGEEAVPSATATFLAALAQPEEAEDDETFDGAKEDGEGSGNGKKRKRDGEEEAEEGSNVVDEHGLANSMHNDVGEQDGKGKSKGKGKGKGKERSAAEIGDVFEELPGRLHSSQDVDGSIEGERPEKAFKTRVYDLADLRAQSKKINLPPLPAANNTSKEEREKTGRWGEQFVYSYLRQKLEAEDSDKRVVWVNEVEETGFQYDLRVEDVSSGEVEAYVEVKTSRCKDKQIFEMSYKEWNFAQKEGNRFVIFRVSNAGKEDVELCSITNPFRQWKDLNLGMCLTL